MSYPNANPNENVLPSYKMDQTTSKSRLAHLVVCDPSDFETLIHKGKLHLTAIPLEVWKKTTICKFVPQVCKAILKEFQQEYLVCTTDPEDWKKIEERFKNRRNVPHAIGALDGKHIAIKKPKKLAVNISTIRATSPWYFWL